MATANPPPGAMPANAGAADPFTGTPTHAHPAPLRYAPFDNEQFSAYSTNSPGQARRALEAHLKDTDRRIQDASKLGTTLLQQRKNLASKLKEVEELQKENEVPHELRQKLAELEKEYNDVGRESARAFLPKSKAAAGEGLTPAVYSSQASTSPSKVSAPSRRQRNQPANRNHDIEFATEISTQLLAQVRQLQAVLAEKEEALDEATTGRTKLEDDHASLGLRMKALDESLQRHKDENWTLETKIQDLETGLRESVDREQRLNHTLKSTQTEKSSAQRDLDDLKVVHEKAIDEHSKTARQHEADLHTLRRDAANHDTDKQTLQKKIEELTSQNTELAKAVSYRWNSQGQVAPVLSASDKDSDSFDDADVDPSEPASPVKGTPARSGMLESETLKSSLNHAHRMIQNLKNNIHREKTEKLELKRMLSDARDELEKRRESGAIGANMSKKRRSEAEAARFRKPARPDRLGADRSSVTEIMEDDMDWEDHDGPSTPSKSRFTVAGAAAGAAGAAGMPGAFAASENEESTDAFETADERSGETATETEAFQTGEEGMDDDSDDLTETEGNANRNVSMRNRASPHVMSSGGSRPSMARNRESYMSTASTSAGESDNDEDVVKTPIQSQGPKYRLRVNRGGAFGGRRSSSRPVSENIPESSPASSMSGTPQPAGKSLGDELDALDDDDSVEGTPNSARYTGTPETQRALSLEPEQKSQRGFSVERSPLSQSLSEQAEDDVVPSIEQPDSEIPQSQPIIGSPFSSPVKARHTPDEDALPHQANAAMLAHESTLRKPTMVDAGVNTEPWQPETQHESLREKAAEVVGGALAGFGLGKPTGHGDDEKEVAGATEPKSLGNTATPPAETKDVATDAEEPQAEMLQEAMPPFEPTPAPVGLDEPKTLRSSIIDATPAAPVVFQQSPIFSQETEPIAPAPQDMEVQPVHLPTENKSRAVPFETSSILSQDTQPVTPERIARSDKVLAAERPSTPSKSSPSGLPQHETERILAATGLAGAAGAVVGSGVAKPKPQNLTFSEISAQDFEPVEAEYASMATPATPLVPKRSSRRLDGWFASEGEAQASEPGAERELANGEQSGYFTGAAPPLTRQRSHSVPASQRTRRRERPASVEPEVYGGVRGAGNIPILSFGEDSDEEMVHSPPPAPQFPSPAGQTSSLPVAMPPLHERQVSNESMIPVTKPLSIKKPVVDGGSQTEVTGDEIERMLRNKNKVSPIAAGGAGALAGAGMGTFFGSSTGSPRRSGDDRAIRRPASSGSMRSKGFMSPPPLPEDHEKKILAATSKTPSAVAATPAPPPAMGSMGPPVMPASAYKQQQNRPKTPVERNYGSATVYRSGSKDGTTPRPPRVPSSPSGHASRRTSVSSFASELDDRFNIHRGNMIYPEDMPPTTDPRMIQAITQTMIGEYLWKYTRKAGRSQVSDSRHRRYFWVHPYTRTLYWSERDPSTAGKTEMKAKSAPIEAVRVITDDNPSPPGLHRKTLVVVTPGREIMFTAPTAQRHETWFNALSYLLLRTEQERHEQDDAFDEEDLAEFNPGQATGFSIRRSISRMTGRSQSRQSLRSHRSPSRGTRTSSPVRPQDQGSLAQRQAAAANRANAGTPTLSLGAAPTLTPTPHGASRGQSFVSSSSRTGRDSAAGGRLSSITSKFRSGSMRGSFSSSARPGAQSAMSGRSDRDAVEGSGIYNASVVSDSAEDLRAVIERQERDADRVENVRACCDGELLSLSSPYHVGDLGVLIPFRQT